MTYVVLGGGAIGGVVAALLAGADADVTLLARGEHLDAVRRDGLRLVRGDRTTTVDLPTAGHPGEVDWSLPGTVLLLAVKSHQTLEAVGPVLAAAPEGVPVVCLQNGVANERTLLRHLDHVHGVCVMMPAAHTEPGVVAAFSLGVPGILDVGRYPSGVDDLDVAVAADLRAAGFLSEPRGDVMAAKHRKLIMNLGNGVDAACVDDGPHGAAAALVGRCRAEGEEVLAAAGIAVVSAEDDAARRADHLRPLARDHGVGSSTWQSLHRLAGRAGATEVDHLNGEVVLQARLLGREAPANEAVRRAVTDLAARGGPPRSLDAAALLAGLG